MAVGSIAPADYHYGARLFKTNDGGISWVISTRLDAGGRGGVAVDPQNPNTIYVATRSSVLRSTDGGTNWKPLGLGDRPPWFWSPSSVTALAIAPSASPSERSSTVYTGTSARGVWKSADGGETWADINSGLTANNIQSLVLDPQNPGTLYGVHGGVEIVKTSDGGMTWRFADSGLPKDAFLGPLAIDPQNAARAYTATSWQGVFRTTDEGASWQAANHGLPEGAAVNGLTIDPQNSSTLYAGIGDDSCWEYGRCVSSGVFKSTDGGTSWSYSGLSEYLVGRVVVAPLNSNLIYAVGFLPRSTGFLPPFAGVASEAWYWGSPAFFKSINGGASWDVLKLPIPSFTGLAINPQEPNTAYVYGGDIFKTSDGGESWSAVDLPSVRTLAIDPQTLSTLYAGTGNGVFRSTDGGATWTAVNSGLTSLAIDTLAIDSQNPSKVFAGTSGGGVFSISFTSPSTPRE